jgi:hypothetical protein
VLRRGAALRRRPGFQVAGGSGSTGDGHDFHEVTTAGFSGHERKSPDSLTTDFTDDTDEILAHAEDAELFGHKRLKKNRNKISSYTNRR